jgi:hypothetical protein
LNIWNLIRPHTGVHWGRGGNTLTKMCTGYRLKTVQKIKEKEMSLEMVVTVKILNRETALALSMFSKSRARVRFQRQLDSWKSLVKSCLRATVE